MTLDEQEILEFYRSGSCIKTISEVYGYSVYRIKKFLANEPGRVQHGYIYRNLTETIPDCQIK